LRWGTLAKDDRTSKTINNSMDIEDITAIKKAVALEFKQSNLPLMIFGCILAIVATISVSVYFYKSMLLFLTVC